MRFELTARFCSCASMPKNHPLLGPQGHVYVARRYPLACPLRGALNQHAAGSYQRSGFWQTSKVRSCGHPPRTPPPGAALGAPPPARPRPPPRCPTANAPAAGTECEVRVMHAYPQWGYAVVAMDHANADADAKANDDTNVNSSSAATSVALTPSDSLPSEVTEEATSVVASTPGSVPGSGSSDASKSRSSSGSGKLRSRLNGESVDNMDPVMDPCI